MANTKAYFVVFKRQKGQTTDAYSIIKESQLKKVSASAPIKWKKEVPYKEIYTKEELRGWLEELGGTWYGDKK